MKLIGFLISTLVLMVLCIVLCHIFFNVSYNSNTYDMLVSSKSETPKQFVGIRYKSDILSADSAQTALVGCYT